MGGTASHILWRVAYDPAMWAVRRACGAASATFVDNLAALVRGAAHALRVHYLLLVAGHASGLLTETHTCCGARFAAPEARVARRLLPRWVDPPTWHRHR